MICDVLKRFGYVVIEARNSSEALAISRENEEEKIDLLITDIIMPEMNGKKLAKKLLRNDPSLKVIYISGYTDDAIAKYGVLDEGVTFLQKPFLPQALAQKVREILDSE